MSEDSVLGVANPLRQRQANATRPASDLIFGDVVRIRASRNVLILDWEGGQNPMAYGPDRELYFDVVGQVLAVYPTPHGAVYVVDQVKDRKPGKITVWMTSQHPIQDV